MYLTDDVGKLLPRVKSDIIDSVPNCILLSSLS